MRARRLTGAAAPRDEDFDGLSRSRPFAPLDERPVWSINCFIVLRQFRGKGLLRLLLCQAIVYAAGHTRRVSR